MPSPEREYKQSNVDYINKDFIGLKAKLIDYAKSYFPNSYKDFNDSSPGMMLMEMSAYVGDVLSFYIDQQYKEMLAPLAREKKNVINIATMLGYRHKPITPAYVDLTVKQTIDSNTTDMNNIVPTYSQATTIDKGMKITSTVDSSIIFETLEVVDFTMSSSNDVAPVQSAWDANTNVVSQFTFERKVKAISGETKTATFIVGQPSKFYKITLADTNVIDIISVVDSQNNTWRETKYLAQDKLPVEKHYSVDYSRANAYIDADGNVVNVPIPYTLEYVKTKKRFVVLVDNDDNTSLIFGNGVLRPSDTSIDDGFIQLEQVGIVIPGESDSYDDTIDPLLNEKSMTLGEAPSSTTLTVTYRIGGGILSNVPSGDLITNDSGNNSISVTNVSPAVGGAGSEDIESIRHNSLAFFASQNRCVTKEDYEARIMGMPAKFGNIAKTIVDRDTDNSHIIAIYTLSYDKDKALTNTPDLIFNNLSNYLNEFRILTDEISITNGKVVNFGVVFDVTSHRSANKKDVKIRCINKIKEFFDISKMQFHQPIYIKDLEYELAGIDGVRSVNYVTVTQQVDYNSTDGTPIFGNGLFDYNVNNQSGGAGTAGYGWQYDFNSATINGVILPSITPSTFELKKSNENVKGVVR